MLKRTTHLLLRRDNGFSAVAKDWLEQKSPQLKASSVVKYNNILQSYLLPTFKTRPISTIQREEIAAYGSRLLTEGGARHTGLAPKTVNDILAVLKEIVQYADRVIGCETADIRRISIKPDPRALRVFSIQEQERLNRFLFARRDPISLGILLSLYTGLRIGELCALRWGDVSIEERSLYVHQTMQRLQSPDKSGNKTQIVVTTPKSPSSTRYIPLPDLLLKRLEAERCPDDCYLLTGQPDHFVEPRSMENRFKTVLRACHVENASFHACRHTFATRCIELGFDIKSLSEILGHASVNITMNRYVHPSMAFKRENMNRLSALIDL